jgi:hypothetical protein
MTNILREVQQGAAVPTPQGGYDMLRFDIEDKPSFARDTDTGEVFGISHSPAQGELWGRYIVNQVEYRLTLAAKSGAPLPTGGFEPTEL